MAVGEIRREDLFARLEELLPRIRARAEETERLRRIPDETVAELKEAGLLRLANPSRFGGYGFDYDVALEVGQRVAAACGSTGWCFMVWSSHNWLIGLYPPEVQEAYFARSHDTLSSSAFNPALGRAEPVAGGYRLSGRWDFSSGADAGEFAFLAAFAPDAGPGLFLVPRSAYELVDTWFVSGLRGTGSKDVLITEPVFVPRERFLAYEVLRAAAAPGRDTDRRPSYKVPFYCVFALTLVAPLIGMAKGAVDDFVAATRSRLTAFDRQRMAALVPIQMAVGEASAMVDAAAVLFRHDFDEMTAKAAQDLPIGVDDRVRYRRDHAYMANLCVAAVERVFQVAGGRSLYVASPLQRAHRDVHAGSHQIALIWHTYAEQYGRVRLGLEPTDHSV